MIDIKKYNKSYIGGKVIKPMYEDSSFPLELADQINDAIEKQIPKQPHTCGSYCPTCGTIVLGTGNPLKKYCEFCGQRLYE